MRRAESHFVECGCGENTIVSRIDTSIAEVLGDYPTLRAVDDQADPGLDHDIAISSMDDLNTYFRFNGGTYNPAGQIFGNYYLTQDIDMSVTEDWTYGWQMDGAFQGNFDGCGYTLSNMHQTRYYTDQAYNRGGFFHSIVAWETGFSTVANLTIADAVIYTDHGGVLACRVHAYAGDGAKIYNCHTSGTVYATSTGGVNQTVWNIGGFVAETYIVTTTGPATFYDCTADVNIVGVPDDSVPYKPTDIGGFIGQAAGSGAFYNCESHGDVTVTGFISDSEYVGGFVGNNPAAVPSWYYYSSATGDVEGDKYVGGFIGGDILYRGYMCSATGDVTCNTSYGGGFIGYSSAAGRMYDSYAWGDVTGGDYIGGYLGYSTYGYFYRSYSIGEVTGTNVGGFAGYTQYTNLSWCHWDTETSGTETSDGGTGHTTTWMKTKPNWEDDHFSWDFDTVWYMEYTAPVEGTPAVPGYWDTLYGYIPDELCVYADGVSLGTFDVNSADANDIIGIDEDAYDVIIAGINYYSIYESFPLVASEIARNQRTVTQRVALDLYQTKGVNLGTSMAYSSPIEFADVNDLYTGFKIAEFPRGTFREPVIFLWIWEPYSTTIRGIYLREEITFP